MADASRVPFGTLLLVLESWIATAGGLYRTSLVSGLVNRRQFLVWSMMNVYRTNVYLFPLPREALGEDPDAKKLVEEEKSRSHKQIEDSRQVRTKWIVPNGQSFKYLSAILSGFIFF